MAHHYTQKGNKRYRYYVCTRAQKRGYRECPAPSIAAGELERFVVEQIRDVGKDPKVVRQTLVAVHKQVETRAKRLRRERGATGGTGGGTCTISEGLTTRRSRIERISDVQGQISESRRRLAEFEKELAMLSRQFADKEITTALADFDEVWEALKPREKSRVLALLIESVECDGENETISITFHGTDIQSEIAA